MADVDGQAGIWLVVPPKIGLPLFLGTVTLIALLVHAAILNHTSWYAAYWEGGKHKTAISTTTEVPTAALAPAAQSNPTR
jgi:light-harvesting protein B-800-850 alpha chain